MPVDEPQSEPEPLAAEEVERLIALAEQGQLEAADQQRIAPLLRTLLWLEHALLETRISLATLKRLLFGKPTEKTPRKPPAEPPEAPADAASDNGAEAASTTEPANDTQDATADGETPNETPAPSPPEPPETPRAPGHGRLGAADYPGAEVQRCAHDHLHPGDLCPACARGRLYAMPPLVRLRFRGQPLVAVTRYELERLRCSACGMLFVAHLPPEVSPERYDTSLKVILAMAHYHLGLPFNRLESFQQMLGQPLPDATQWELVEQVADVGYVVFNHLQGYAAQLEVVFQDDTRARVLSLIKENQAEPPPARQAIYTTALRCEGARSVCLFFTGRQHAGENLDDLMALRQPGLPRMLRMADALAANTLKRHGDRVVNLNCLTHARRQFVDIQAFFPGECDQVIAAIATVYQQEAQCVEAELNPAQRLAHHQAHSAPVMASLKRWMQQQFDEKQVEPNSRLGQAFNYMLKRWAALTGFLRIPGAPLDNNPVEQVLKLSVRYRNNSLFYKTLHGAYVGDVIASLIETCRLNGVNPIDYLSALLHNRSAVFADPAAWLPWTFESALTPNAQAPPLGDTPPVSGHAGVLGVAVP
ncbi:IS66 family transposase [Lamprobacter modestohalophilus]|uniref:IS66 family transposase n=3 Tax=Lamprobacter modestohalophilus TaxID=1064514 RepID=UPI002ADEAD4A|nr:IS66 family transposase [Lamprobacter modestohalophilus]MEA1052294.1 IS66 family transposase [Lamprobacter modestohalophilus]